MVRQFRPKAKAYNGASVEGVVLSPGVTLVPWWRFPAASMVVISNADKPRA